MSKIKDCILLAGGYGTRLKAVVPGRQKVVAEVQGQPFLNLILDQLSASGIQRVVLCVHYLGEQVQALVGNSYKNLSIEYSFEQSPLGTAGAIKKAWNQFFRNEQEILAMNGDSLCLADFQRYFNWFLDRPNQNASGLLLARVQDSSRYGSVNTDDAGNISQFAEKGVTAPGYINAGVYLLSKAFLQSIPNDKNVSLEKEIFPAWVGKGLLGYKEDAPFIDIGVPESYAAIESFLISHTHMSESKHHPGKIVLVDRDGTVIVEKDYLHDPDQVEILPGTIEGLRLLKQHGFTICVVTNQSGVSRKYYTIDDVHAVHRRLSELLNAEGIEIDDFFICPHQDSDQCLCRKPKTGLIEQVHKKYQTRYEDIFVIGDKECDVAMGKAVGATSILVRTGYGHEYERDGHSGDIVKNNLHDAAEWILRKQLLIQHEDISF